MNKICTSRFYIEINLVWKSRCIRCSHEDFFSFETFQTLLLQVLKIVLKGVVHIVLQKRKEHSLARFQRRAFEESDTILRMWVRLRSPRSKTNIDKTEHLRVPFL